MLGLPPARDAQLSGSVFASSSCQNLHLRDAGKVSCPAESGAMQQSKTSATKTLLAERGAKVATYTCPHGLGGARVSCENFNPQPQCEAQPRGRRGRPDESHRAGHPCPCRSLHCTQCHAGLARPSQRHRAGETAIAKQLDGLFAQPKGHLPVAASIVTFFWWYILGTAEEFKQTKQKWSCKRWKGDA